MSESLNRMKKNKIQDIQKKSSNYDEFLSECVRQEKPIKVVCVSINVHVCKDFIRTSNTSCRANEWPYRGVTVLTEGSRVSHDLLVKLYLKKERGKICTIAMTAKLLSDEFFCFLTSCIYIRYVLISAYLLQPYKLLFVSKQD